MKKRVKSQAKRPSCVVRARDWVEKPVAYYKDIGSDEVFTEGAPLGKIFGFRNFAVHYEILRPGHRSCWPHAEADEDEFAFLISGKLDLWLNGRLYPLHPGEAVGFPAGRGETHCFINNSKQVATFLVVGDKSGKGGRVHYPLHPERNKQIGKAHWKTWPVQPLGMASALPRRTRRNKL